MTDVIRINVEKETLRSRVHEASNILEHARRTGDARRADMELARLQGMRSVLIWGYSTPCEEIRLIDEAIDRGLG